MKPIAIKIENKRQFDALMKHYEEKGWTNYNEIDYFSKSDYRWQDGVLFEYSNNYQTHLNKGNWIIIDFDTFSQLTGVKVVEEVDVEITPFLTAKVQRLLVEFPEPIYRLGLENIKKIHSAMQSLK